MIKKYMNPKTRLKAAVHTVKETGAEESQLKVWIQGGPATSEAAPRLCPAHWEVREESMSVPASFLEPALLKCTGF